MSEPLPKAEATRLAALRAQEILDSPRERAFDDIVQLAQFVCGVPMALVTLVDENRQWFKARVGLAMTETPRDQSFCAHALGSHAPLIIEDTHEDPRFADNALVVGGPGIRSYAGVPIYVEDGAAAVGTLCVLDRVPRKLSTEQLAALTALARRVETELRLRRSAMVASVQGGSATAGPRLASGVSQPPGALGLSENDVVGGRYRIERLLGEGGMGRVYLATDSVAGGRVALKVMAGVSVSSGESLERFVREARVLLLIRSANVARLLDAGNLADGAPYFAMEYLEGHDLSHEPLPMPPADALALALQACDGVAAIHDAGVVHRDLKPGNLFVARDGDLTTLKVVDFGIAKLTGQGADDQQVADGSLTSAVAVLGTPRYMSPEQLLSSRDVDASTDIWALGILFYELLTHEHPFDGTTITEICASIFTKGPRPMRERTPAIPAALDEVVLGCLALDKNDRWPTVRALRAALAALR